MRVYPPVEQWSLWAQSWNYETKFVPLNNGEVLRLDYRPPLQWWVRKDVPTEGGWTTSVVFNGLGNPEGNLQSVVCWGRRLWHEGQRRIPLRLNIRITGRADDQLQALRPGACKIAHGSLSNGMSCGEVWSEPDGFGGWLCWLRRSNSRRKEQSPRWFYSASPAVPERMFSAMVRCSGIRTRDHMTRAADALLLESTSYQRDDEAIEAAIARVGGAA